MSHSGVSSRSTAFVIDAMARGLDDEPLFPADDQPADSTFKFAVKDNIATLNSPTTCASAFLRSYQSPFEATIVRQLRDRGGAFVGKTNMDEFGMGSHSVNSVHGPVTNPNFDASAPRSAGGSSGGSAVAVRLLEADVALGTDTGGSIRLPAAYSGTVGFKPSYGMLSRFGVVPYANSLDTVGFFARDVRSVYDLIIGSGLIREHDPNDPTSLTDASRKRCAETHGHNNKPVLHQGAPPLIHDAWREAADALREWGAKIVPVSLPRTELALPAYYIIAPAEASSNLAKYDGVRYGARGEGSDGAGEVLYSDTRGQGFGEEVKRRILLGTYSLSSDKMDNFFIQAQKVRRLVQQDFDRVFKLSNPSTRPSNSTSARWTTKSRSRIRRDPRRWTSCSARPLRLSPLIEDIDHQTAVDSYMNDVFTVPASLAGLPSISIPVPVKGATPETGPVAGLQLIGQYWDDGRVLAIAHELLQRAPVSI
ncbi:unnamed protein product [Parascedosporium putredinis]|uniref:Glutamyl-tRNA(Gln) amidotransferase subunit A, mitochondrial n=1 Tax=Parascedosporium putredinis TaxID=1442378 RepID=A0A9P1M837_9PEZI|nr:unnamed protein product [Parascedosporium putredinis]CAI7988288.1 unnamed protein product [Parascedosporium putredinis]